jgi:tetratricopeptide (TPR) repeat protein
LAPQKQKLQVVIEKKGLEAPEAASEKAATVIAKKEITPPKKGDPVPASDDAYDEKKYFFKKIIMDREKAKKLVQKSHLSLQSHDWSEAIRTATEAIALNQDYADAYNNRAWGYYEKGLLDESIADCNKALEIDPNHFYALNNRGRAYQKKGDIVNALRDFQAACKHELPEACENYKKITRLAPEEEIKFLLVKGREELAAHKFDQLLETATQIISIDAQNGEGYVLRCRAYIENNMFSEAEGDCANAASLAPESPEYFFNLGLLAEKSGEKEKALESFRKSCELQSEIGCQHYERLQEPDREIAASFQVDARNNALTEEEVPDVKPVLESKAPASSITMKEELPVPAKDELPQSDILAENRKEEAKIEEQAASLPEVDVSDLLEKSRKAFIEGNYDAVIDFATQIIATDQGNAEAYSNRCGALAMEDKFSEAKADCIKAVSINPDFSMAYNNLGWVFEQQGDIQEAIRQYEMSCKLGNTLGCQNQKRLEKKK